MLVVLKEHDLESIESFSEPVDKSHSCRLLVQWRILGLQQTCSGFE